MTLKLITTVQRYIGDTGEAPTGVNVGSTFFDRQTGIMYVTYDGTNWVEKPSADTLATLLGGGLPAALAAGGGLKVEGVAGGVAQPVSGTVTSKESWAPTLTADVTDNDSDKSFTVPASTEWQPTAVLVDLTTTATVGNRQMSVLLTTGADVVIAEARAGAVQAASLTRRYVFGLGEPDLTAFRDTTLLTTPLPALVLPAAYKVRVYDKAAVDAAADDMHVQLLVQARSV